VRRVVLAVVALVGLLLAAATGLADATLPEFDVYTVNQTRGAMTSLSLEVILLPGSPAATMVVITVPAGYGAKLAQQIGSRLGNAEVDLAGGTSALIKGVTTVSDPNAFAANPLAQACAPGAHTATWSLNLDDSTSVPIAVDTLASGGGYRVTVCLNALQHPGSEPVDVYFELNGVFRNPAAPQIYWWRALVTPTDASGAASPAGAFELQGGEPIPEPLTFRTTWDARHHLLTAHGVLIGGGAPRSAIHVHLFAGATGNKRKMREIGVATTTRSGAYIFRQHRATKPAYLYAHVRFYIFDQCLEPTTAPAGCVSRTIDGTDSVTVKTR
jgi:hypothetical protein